jgi:hypothetical protein
MASFSDAELLYLSGERRLGRLATADAVGIARRYLGPRPSGPRPSAVLKPARPGEVVSRKAKVRFRA